MSDLTGGSSAPASCSKKTQGAGRIQHQAAWIRLFSVFCFEGFCANFRALAVTKAQKPPSATHVVHTWLLVKKSKGTVHAQIGTSTMVMFLLKARLDPWTLSVPG